MFVNVPIGVAAVALSQKFLPDSGGWLKDRRLDLPGAVTVTSGLVLLVYGLTDGANVGFGALETYLPMGLSALVLAAFVAIEARSKSPLLPLAFLRRGSVMTANLLGLVLASTVVVLVLALVGRDIAMVWIQTRAHQSRQSPIPANLQKSHRPVHKSRRMHAPSFPSPPAWMHW